MTGNALMHYFKYLLGLDKPDTQTTLNERNAISEYAANAKCCVEIGVFEGVNTITIAEAMDAHGKLYAIDPFFKGSLGICYHEKIAKNSIRSKKLGKRVKLLPLFSYDAVKEVPDEIDFIFIDGDHSYEGIKRDWEDWAKKLAPGGIIALHDTSVPVHNPAISELGSYRFYNEVIVMDNKFEKKATVDSLNILKKIK